MGESDIKKRNFAEVLLSMPNVGDDQDFLREQDEMYSFDKEVLSGAEARHISELLGKLKKGDDSDFDSWDKVKLVLY